MTVGFVISERAVGERAIRAPVRRVVVPRNAVLPPPVTATCGSTSASIWSMVSADARSAMTTHPSCSSTSAISAGDFPEPTERTAFGMRGTIRDDIWIFQLLSVCYSLAVMIDHERRPRVLPYRFGVQASVAPTMSVWRDQARMAEDLGYSTLYIADHFGDQFGPLVATTVAAEATSSLHVGALVLNNDLRNPVVLAKEIATLGLAAEGRVEVGLGAGWLRSDYEEAGIEYDAPAVRVDRLAESLAVMKSLWSEGKATFAGKYHTVHD